MDGLGLLGIFLILYAGFIVYITIKKPKAMWEMYKVKRFRKILGEKGAEIFFYIISAAAVGVGIWLIIKK